MWLRRRKTPVPLDEGITETLADPQAPSPAEETIANETRSLVREAISQLSEEYRLAVTMYYIDGLSYREIGQFLDVPQTTIKNRLHRARQQLRKELMMVEQEFKSHPLSEEFSEQVLQEVEIINIVTEKEGTSFIQPQNAHGGPALFSVEWKDLSFTAVGELQKDQEALRRLFEENGTSLAQYLTFAKAGDRLLIQDHGNRRGYVMAKEDDHLNVRRIPYQPSMENVIAVLRLKDDPQHCLSIWIALEQGMVISQGVKGIETPRPMTHDLLLTLLKEADATIQQIVLTDLQQTTFIAKMIIDFSGTVKEIDCRPSDAMAIAAKAKLPILVAQKLRDREGVWILREQLQGTNQKTPEPTD